MKKVTAKNLFRQFKPKQPRMILKCNICKQEYPRCNWCNALLLYDGDYNTNFCLEYNNKILHFDEEECIWNFFEREAEMINEEGENE